MAKCVRSAREAGVFKEFHVLCDTPIEGCASYDAYQFDKANGLFKLHYLKVGMSRLAFDFFIWLDADSIFLRNPVDVLGPLSRSPIHVPLELNLCEMREDHSWKGVSCFSLRDALRKAGIMNQTYLSRSAFWIVHRDAIDQVYDLALQFWNERKSGDPAIGVDAALGYAMQMLCGDPQAHLLGNRPDLWISDDTGQLAGRRLHDSTWEWRHACATTSLMVHPAIAHVPAERVYLGLSDAGNAGLEFDHSPSSRV